jgi:hypothetical protein
MSAYNPPRENVPIFDSSLFNDEDEGGGLTQGEADLLYLKWPIGQQNEQLNGSTTMTGQTTVLNSNLILDGVFNTNYLEFPDGTQQFTAATGGGFISLQQITPTATLTDISVPPNTQWCRIFAIGWGGVAGANTTVQGGGGGAGASIIWPNLPIGNTSGTSLPVFSSVILTPDNSYALSWAASYSTGQRIATVGAGQVGNPAVGSVTGSGGAGGKIDNNNFFGQAGNSIGGQSGGVIPQSAQLPALLNYFYKTLALGVGSGGYNLSGSPVAPTAGKIFIWSYG